MGPELGTELVPLPWLGDVVLTSDHYPATGQVSYGFGCLWSGVLVSTGGYWRVLAGDVFGAHVVGRARGPCCEGLLSFRMKYWHTFPSFSKLE